MLKLLALFALLLVSGHECAPRSAVPTNDLDTISLYIKAVLENLRQSMPQGVPELSIPPLEPLSVPVIDIPPIKEGIADVNLKMQDLILRGLSSFVVDKAEGDLQNLGVNLELYFPSLEGQAKYDLDGKVLIFPLYGKGRAMLQVNDLRFKVAAQITIVGTKVQLRDVSVDSTFSQVMMYLEGIVGGGNLGDVINTLLNSLGKLVYDKTKSMWLPELNRILKDVINNELKKVDLQDIIGGVLPFGTKQLAAAPRDAASNQYVDQLLEQARPIFKQFDPLPIPDQVARFSKKVGFVTVWGEAKLNRGSVAGLSTLHRTGDCSFGADGGTLKINCQLGINNLNGGFSARASFMGIGVSASVRFSVSRVRVGFGVRADLASGGNPQLDQFSIRELASVRVSVSGLGPLDWILGPVVSVVIKAVKGIIISAIEGPIKNAINGALGSIQLPGM